MGKGRERQIILKTDKRTIFVEMRPGRMLQAKSSGWDEDRLFLECGKREIAVKTARGVMAHLPTGRPPGETTARRDGGASPSRRNAKVTSSRDTVTRSDAVTFNAAATGVQVVRFPEARR
jgi:hypothetical protein